jgi:phosphoenolpyruvate synthase/pyruvate phosphate dikinase
MQYGAASPRFTAHPVTGKRRQAVIDANPGLGEAVVSGATNPDHFVVDIVAQVHASTPEQLAQEYRAGA